MKYITVVALASMALAQQIPEVPDCSVSSAEGF